jgi:hypothetical protein
MAEENGALNTDAGSSPVPAEVGGLVSTLEFQSPKPEAADADPEGAKNTEGTEKTAKGKEAEGGKTGEAGAKDKPAGEDDRFDKHPRFQELNRRVKESDDVIRKLEKTVTELSAKLSKPSGDDAAGVDGNAPYKDISKMKAEELLDWQSEDPHGYYKNVLAQAKHELTAEFTHTSEQRAKEDAVVSTFENFAKQHPDFDEMWDAGDLQQFMQSNPGHNAISAYWAITAEAKVQEAAEKAAKEAEAKFIKNQRAKKVSDVLPQGPSAPAGSMVGDDALKDTKKFGGTTAVLAQRLADRRRSQAGM